MGKSDSPCWLGFDLGGTKMMAAVLDKDFRIVGSHRVKTKGLEGAKEVLGRIVETIEEALREARVQAEELGGIGVGCPGPLDLDQGIILQPSFLVGQDLAQGTLVELCPGYVRPARRGR